LRVFLSTICLVLASTASAQVSVEAELEASAGHDNALFRLVPVLPANIGNADLFWETRPQLNLIYQTTSGHYLSGGYQGLYRDFRDETNGITHGHLGKATYAKRVGENLWPSLSAWGGVERSSAVTDNNYTAYGATLDAAYAWNEALTTTTGVDVQVFDGVAINTKLFGPTASLLYSLSDTHDLGVNARWLTDAKGFHQLAAGLSSDARFGDISTTLEASGGKVGNGAWAAWGALGKLSVTESWSIGLRYRGSLEAYPGAGDTLINHRAGVIVGYSWRSRPDVLAALPPIQPKKSPDSFKLIVEVKGAQRVEILGDFNRWKPRALTAVDEKIWQIKLKLKDGRYAYQLRIDGTLVVPKRAQGYEDDGFGAKNAILIVSPFSGQSRVAWEP